MMIWLERSTQEKQAQKESEEKQNHTHPQGKKAEKQRGWCSHDKIWSVNNEWECFTEQIK